MVLLLLATKPVPSEVRTVRLPGVPFQLALGWKCSLVPAANTRALLSETEVAMLYQVLPLSVEYCQTPWPAVAALPVMAIPASAVAVEPPETATVTVSVASEYRPVVLIRLVMVAPALLADVMSSATLASVVLPLEIGASLTALTEVPSATVAALMAVVPP